MLLRAIEQARHALLEPSDRSRIDDALGQLRRARIKHELQHGPDTMLGWEARLVELGALGVEINFSRGGFISPDADVPPVPGNWQVKASTGSAWVTVIAQTFVEAARTVVARLEEMVERARRAAVD